MRVTAGPYVLVMDLDGTALDNSGALPEVNKIAINSFVAKGGLLIVSTGRTRGSALEVLEGVDLSNCYLTCDNGCEIYDSPDSEGVSLPGISRQDFNAVISFVRSGICRVNVFIDDSNCAPLYPYNFTQCLANLVRRFQGSRSRTVARPSSISKRNGACVKKIWLRGLAAERISELNALLSSSQAYLINDYEVVEVGALASGKLAAVELILAGCEIAPERVYVVGDDGNDIDLLRKFPNSYAVANARKEVKAAAAHVVSSNNQFGVAEVLGRIDADRRCND